MTKTSSGAQWAGERPKTDLLLSRNQTSSILAQLQASMAAAKQNEQHRQLPAGKSSVNGTGIGKHPTANELDIALLREKSKHLDLPLIAALCNDRSLLKQTKVLANPGKDGNKKATAMGDQSTCAATSTATSLTNGSSVGSNAQTTTAGNNKTLPAYTATTPITTTTITATAATATASTLCKARKAAISHRHPNDKLPPLPMQLAEANNYVMDPAILKHHKSYNNSHT